MDKVMQISIFAENKLGKMEKVTKVLSDSKINILAISITSTNGFGIIKFMVDKPELALAVLKKDGFTVSLTEVLAIEMDDQPGGLHEVVSILAQNNINIENASVYVAESRKRAYLLVEVKDIDNAKKLFENTSLKLYRREK
ncbi:MAG: ACT domain-containing protein [Dissulfurispiraceae bacterium]